jgi:hypothetical protein
VIGSDATLLKGNKSHYRAWSRVFQADQALLGSRDAFGPEQKTVFFVLLVSKMAN